MKNNLNIAASDQRGFSVRTAGSRKITPTNASLLSVVTMKK